MGKRRRLPPAATKCRCGHAFHEHVLGGDQHACQHGAKPPFTHMCPCKKFRTKEEELARAELKRRSRRAHPKRKAEPEVGASSAATAGLKTPPTSTQDGAPKAEAVTTDLVDEKPPESQD